MGALSSRAARIIAVTLAAVLLVAAGAVFAMTRSGDDAGEQASVLPAAPEPDAAFDVGSGESLGAPERATEIGSGDRSVIVHASQQVEVLDVADAGRRFAAAVVAAGGTITAENTSYGDPCPPQPLDEIAAPCVQQASSTITYRADAAAVGGLLDEAAALGTELWRSRSALDVSADVADIDARVASARASLARLNALMSRAESLGDVIALEGQIAARQADLEALLARQQSLADQTAAATVTTTFSAAPPASDSPGFTDGLQAGLDALGTALRAIAVGLGWLIPVAAVAAAILLPLLWWRRRRSRRGDAAASPVDDRTEEPAASA